VVVLAEIVVEEEALYADQAVELNPLTQVLGVVAVGRADGQVVLRRERLLVREVVGGAAFSSRKGYLHGDVNDTSTACGGREADHHDRGAQTTPSSASMKAGSPGVL
jgi:hypothetical protein